MERDSNEKDVSSASQFTDDLRENHGELSPLAIGYMWVVRITAFCFEFVALVLLGRFIDVRFGLKSWGLIGGFVIGLYAFVSGLTSTVKKLEETEERD